MRVLIADKLSTQVIEQLESAGCAVTVDASLSDDRLTEALSTVDPEVLVVRSTKVQAAQLQAATSLSLVIRAGAGTNTIDVATASGRGVYVANCPGKNAIAVAELAMGHLLNMDRRIADNVAALRAGQWNKKEFGKARGLFGRTIAVLGVGQIGREVALRARAFGMTVRGWDKLLTPQSAAELDIEWCATPREACAGADAVTVHLPMLPETKGLIGRELLEALRPGAYVINTSRGGIVDEAALAEAIKTRGLRAGLDVFETEPSAAEAPFESPIVDNASVYGTHHIGASTDQASEAVGEEVGRIVLAYLNTGRVPNCVNVAERSPATHLLVIRHADRVGVLAGVLDVLREHEINVQEMENVVFSGATAACARIQVDSTPTPDVLTRIEANPDIFATSLVALEA